LVPTSFTTLSFPFLIVRAFGSNSSAVQLEYLRGDGKFSPVLVSARPSALFSSSHHTLISEIRARPFPILARYRALPSLSFRTAPISCGVWNCLARLASPGFPFQFWLRLLHPSLHPSFTLGDVPPFYLLYLLIVARECVAPSFLFWTEKLRAPVLSSPFFSSRNRRMPFFPFWTQSAGRVSNPPYTLRLESLDSSVDYFFVLDSCATPHPGTDLGVSPHSTCSAFQSPRRPPLIPLSLLIASRTCSSFLMSPVRVLLYLSPRPNAGIARISRNFLYCGSTRFALDPLLIWRSMEGSRPRDILILSNSPR